MKRKLKDRKGSITLLYFGMAFLLLMMTFLVIETGSTLENYSYAETVLQRCCNSAVEQNIIDAYRADHILRMDTSGAARDFRSYVMSDLPAKYRFTIQRIRCTAEPPTMEVIGTIRFDTVFSQYGFGSITHTVKVVSTNYALDGR
jgi:Flp pilus assembly protein TadG